ncbi:MAG: hypothetical protein LC798_07920, partial [Chloroflexi bacterium]|nr:hypothetical protein [Chloroflexota bacterium]
MHLHPLRVLVEPAFDLLQPIPQLARPIGGAEALFVTARAPQVTGPNQPLRTIHFTSSRTGTIVAASVS